MYIEKIENTEDGKELTIDFGKNMLGLSDELLTIGKKINSLSEDNRVLLCSSFIDEKDDVYQLKFVILPK